ncbi:MAG TPA: patatin-like phospholipase family protein [Verrucomicrobiae bacterium]|nr:patatin-like phospholipase family protein [Verrucomicrobiae bacterium]
MKRILALDGGGVRGVFTLQILAEIEKHFRAERKNPSLVLADVFDLVAGTSTGAIIASFLSWGLPVREIEKLYIEQGPEMFARGRWTQQWKAKYKPENIARFFRERFAEDDGAPALLGTKKLRTLLLIVMRNGSTGGLWPVSNNPKAKYNVREFEDGTPNRECNLDFPLWQLLRASTAAPTFFPPEEILLAGKPHLFMDGGITPYNNPALIAALMATLPRYRIEWPVGRESIHVISVGTGFARAKMPDKAAANVNLLDHIRYIAPALIGSVAWEQDFLCRVLGDCVHGAALDFELGALETPSLLPPPEQKFTYARYDQPLDHTHPKIKMFLSGQAGQKRSWWKFLKSSDTSGKHMQLDDLKLIPLLQELGQEYAEKHVRREHLHPRDRNVVPCKCSQTED